MASTDTIGDALITDLLTIAGIVQVSSEPRLHTEMAKPGACLMPGGGGTSDPFTLSNLRGNAEHRFVVRLFVSSSTPRQDLDNLMDAARNAIERSGSALAAVVSPAVDHATVVEWNDVSTDESVAQNTWIRDLTVAVHYLYSRGSL